MFNNSKIRITMLLMLQRIQRQTTSIRMILSRVPRHTHKLCFKTKARRYTRISRSITVTVNRMRRVRQRTLTIKEDYSMNIRFMRENNRFASNTILFVFAIIFMIRSYSRTNTTIRFPSKTSKKFCPRAKRIFCSC